MNKRMAERLAKRIEREDPRCSAKMRHWDNGGYDLQVVETVTGGLFVVTSPEAWDQRREDSFLDMGWE